MKRGTLCGLVCLPAVLAIGLSGVWAGPTKATKEGPATAANDSRLPKPDQAGEGNADAGQAGEKASPAQPKLAAELGAPFSDNAILQREMTVPVWGWSKPGTTVTVEFAGQKKTAQAGKDRKWMVWLDPLKASFEPAEMTISESTGKKVTIKNILVGEVWFASGQSNMQWLAGKCDCANLKVAAKGQVAPIREFEVTSVYAMLHPIEHATGVWKNGDYGNYSAVALAFAHKLYNELDVPIGILNCSFSQTAIQAWVPRQGFRDAQDEYTKTIYQKIIETDPNSPEHKAAWSKYYAEIENALKEGKEIAGKPPGNLDGNRDASWLFNGRLSPVVPYGVRGAIWNQGYANMHEGLPYYNNLHSLIRGWRLVWGKPELPVYFHQFYCPGAKGERNNSPSIGSTAEMRLGTWLARDIPNAGMASQIDIEGAIHYRNKAVPGQRLALQALKNQYGKKVVADGPMFKSYSVAGNKLMVEFEHADGGLVVAETGSNASEKQGTGFADPKIIENGADQVKLFYLADDNRVWYPASVKIDGEKVIVTSPQVKSPRGVSYGTGGIGFQPNLYNRALLPATPFIYYDQKLVTSKAWPDEKLTIFGEEIDRSTVGKMNEYRKMPLLSTQFRNNAVFQAGMPVTIWGSAVHDWGYEAKGKAEIKFSFAAIEKTIPVTPGMREWQVTLPAMEASAEPKTLKVTFTIDGAVAHERVCTNIVIGEVWYVAAPAGKFDLPVAEKSKSPVRMLTRNAKRDSFSRPSRYSVSVSTTPDNRFASEWENATGFAAALGNKIGAKTGKPVGIIFMQGAMTDTGDKKHKSSADLNQLKRWIPAEALNQAASLMDDYQNLAGARPGTEFYAANGRRYMAAWQKYWSDYIPEMIATKAEPDGAQWGSYPTLLSSVTSTAGEVYNVMVCSLTPGALRGVIFFSSPVMIEKDQGANFGEQLTVLANSWKERFGGDPHFFYTIPDKTLAPKITQPQAIKGRSVAVTISSWPSAKAADNSGWTTLIEEVMGEVYK